MLVSCNETPKVLKPTDRPLDFPSSTISPQFATVLCGSRPSVTTMRENQIDSTTLQPLSQRITIGSRVVDQATRFASKDSFFNKRFNQRYFVRTSAGCVDSKREPSRVGKNHDLGSFTSLGLANLFTPFFAEENVPSAIASTCFTRPWRSSKRANRAHAFSQMPDSDHCLWRRQQVVVEGKYFGRSFHRAPLRSIQRMPSTQGREAITGRPPLSPTGVSGNRSAIRCHCSSVSSYSGSVVDPAGNFTTRRDRFAMSHLLSVVLITTNARLWFS